MKKVNKEVIREILQKNYGIVPEILVRVRRKSDRQVWYISSSEGVYACKYVEECTIAERVAAVNQYLFHKGFPVVTVLPTLAGTPYVHGNNGCFLLFPWLEGTRPSYVEPGMIERMTTLLAQFHESSRGYVATGGTITDQRLDWQLLYQKKIEKLGKMWKKSRSLDDPFTKLFLSNFPWFRERFMWVLARLPETTLNDQIAKSMRDPLLGHGDYSHLNLLSHQNAELTLIDLDTVSIALPMRDISHLLTWINQELGDWSGERLQLILDAYRSVRPLSAREQELLLIDQVFPHKALRLAKKYFEGRGGTTLLEEFERCIQIDKDKLNDLGIGPR